MQIFRYLPHTSLLKTTFFAYLESSRLEKATQKKKKVIPYKKM